MMRALNIAPPLAPLVLLIVAVVSMTLDYRWSREAVQPAAEALALPMYHPLGCPVADDAGKPLRATMRIAGERKQRCYY